MCYQVNVQVGLYVSNNYTTVVDHQILFFFADVDNLYTVFVLSRAPP